MSSESNGNSGTPAAPSSSSSSSLEEDMTKASITSAPIANNPDDEQTKKSGGTTDEKDCKDDGNANKDPDSLSDSSTDDDDDNNNDDDDDVTNDNIDKDPVTLLSKALTFKEEGNNLFKSQKFTQASRTYKKGINLIKHLHNGIINSHTNDDQVTALLLSLQSNLCMVYYKLENYKQCHAIADYIITKIDDQNSKAWYRRGLSNHKLNNISNAKFDLHKAYTINPKDKAIVKEYRIVKKQYDTNIQKSKQNLQKQKKALAKAFEGGSNSSCSILYNDKEEELKRKQEKQKQKEEEERILKEKRKIDWENDCVKRMSNNEDVLSFEEYEKELKKKEEEEEKARKKARKEKEEEENRKRLMELEERRRHRKGGGGGGDDDSGDDDDDDDDDILTERELQSLRGYKKTSDGRTTSYFTREQTEEEKKLLGSIAPKKLDTPTPNATSEGGISPTVGGSATATATPTFATGAPQRLDSSVSMTSSSSAWNQAGTWEEKDTSEWCNTSLEKYLELATGRARSTGGDGNGDSVVYEAFVTKVKDLKGDASVAFVSGKKRYVFDYSAALSFEIKASENQNEEAMDVDDDSDKVGKKSVVAKGSLSLPDISSTSISDEEIEVQVMKWKKEPRDQYKDGVNKCREDLINNVREQVFAFVSAFNSQY